MRIRTTVLSVFLSESFPINFSRELIKKHTWRNSFKLQWLLSEYTKRNYVKYSPSATVDRMGGLLEEKDRYINNVPERIIAKWTVKRWMLDWVLNGCGEPSGV